MEIKYYNVMMNGRSFFDQLIKIFVKTYDYMRKIANGQGNEYTTGCSLDYPYFKKYHKLIAIDLSKQQKLNADPKAIQLINFNGYLTRAEGATIFTLRSKKKQKQFHNFQREKLKSYNVISC